jgi:tape measure domain-containing protein
MAEKTVYVIDLQDKVTPKLKGVQSSAKKLDNDILGINSSLSKIGIGAGIAAVVGIGKAIYDITAAAEQSRISFEVMLGDVGKAGKMINEIRDFAAKTPFETADLEKAATTMLGYGISAKDIMPNIRMLGDVARGDAEKFDRLTYAFSQIHATGRLMGQDLMQLVNAGFNPLKIISEETGISMGELKQKMSDGAISSELVSKAFKVATQEGGLFYGMMEKQSQTLQGKFSTLKDTVVLMGLSIGENAAGGMHKFYDVTLKLLESLRDSTWGDFGAAFSQSLTSTYELFSSLGQLFSAVGGDAFTFQRVIDGITIAMRLMALPIHTAIYLVKELIESFRAIGDFAVKAAKGDFSGATKAFDRMGKNDKAFADKLMGIASFTNADGTSRGFGEKMLGEEKSYSRSELSEKSKTAFGLPVGISASDIGMGKGAGGKTSKSTAGGINLNESKNGSTVVTFNIDTFQKNEFEMGGVNDLEAGMQTFLSKMASALTTVMADSQVVAYRG